MKHSESASVAESPDRAEKWVAIGRVLEAIRGKFRPRPVETPPPAEAEEIQVETATAAEEVVSPANVSEGVEFMDSGDGEVEISGRIYRCVTLKQRIDEESITSPLRTRYLGKNGKRLRGLEGEEISLVCQSGMDSLKVWQGQYFRLCMINDSPTDGYFINLKTGDVFDEVKEEIIGNIFANGNND